MNNNNMDPMNNDNDNDYGNEGYDPNNNEEDNNQNQ
jgi:hypothetical protein